MMISQLNVFLGLIQDRDRNAIKDLDKRNILFSKILSNILKRKDDIKK